MTPEQVALVQASVAGLRPRLPLVADGFYARLFADAPQVRSMFPDDLTVQRVKFADEVETIIEAIPDFDAFEAEVHELGARHHDYGVTASHYPLVKAALLGSLAAELADAWTAEMADAWDQAYDLVAESMMLGAADVARSSG